MTFLYSMMDINIVRCAAHVSLTLLHGERFAKWESSNANHSVWITDFLLASVGKRRQHISRFLYDLLWPVK